MASFKRTLTRFPFVVIPTKYGILLTPPASPKAQMLGTYESYAFTRIKSVLGPNDTFVDIGAHAGYYTLMSSRLAKNVVAFEPNPSVYKLLRLNILLNGVKNVIAIRAAVSDFDGWGKFYIPKKGGISLTSQGTLLTKAKDSVDVPVVMLDTVLEHIGQPSVIKIDVEGAELNVIKGCLRTLAKGVRLLVIELHYNTPTAKNLIVELLQGLGYITSEKNKFLFVKAY